MKQQIFTHTAGQKKKSATVYLKHLLRKNTYYIKNSMGPKKDEC